MPAAQYLWPGHLDESIAPPRVFSDLSLWNTVKDPSPTFYAGADSVLSTANVFLNDGDFDHPAYFATGAEANVTIHLGHNQIGGASGGTLVKPAPSGMHPAAGSDGVMFIQFSDGTWIDGYAVTRNSNTDFTFSEFVHSTDGPGNIDVATGFGTVDWRAGTTGIGSAQVGGTILQRDAIAGVIPHGIFIAGTDGNVLGDGGGFGISVPPARDEDISGGGPIPEGALLQIPSDATRPGGLSTLEDALFDCLQTYGAYVCDQTGTNPSPFYVIYTDGSAEATAGFSGGGFVDVCHLLRMVHP